MNVVSSLPSSLPSRNALAKTHDPFCLFHFAFFLSLPLATHGRTQPHFGRVKKKSHNAIVQTPSKEYGGLIGGIAELLEAARRVQRGRLTRS